MSKVKSKLNRKYGWVPQLKDHRDHKFSLSKSVFSGNLPSKVDLRPKDAPIYDQGQLGSCTANGIAGIIQFIQKDLMPSRLFIYYNERFSEGTVDQDAGADIRDGIQSVVQLGVCSEDLWAYDISKFATQPDHEAYNTALKDVVTEYLALNNVDDIKNCLASGYPVVFGATLYNSFESSYVAETGLVPMPASNDEIIGGHCMVIIGFDDENNWFIVRNSWGTGWGKGGYCFIPYAYINEFASDMWTIRADTEVPDNNPTHAILV